MAANEIRNRIVDLVSVWFNGDGSWQPKVLSSPRLDLAVAHGAAYYAMVRRGQGVRIAANLGRTYYLQIESQPPRGLCLIPGDAEAGQTFRTEDHPLQLKIGTPVQFPLWVSSTRLADRVGEMIDIDRRETTPLPPICTALVRSKRRDDDLVQVVIESELSEIGTVGLYCVDSESRNRWRLEFDIRSTLETDRQSHDARGESAGIIDSETVDRCGNAIARVFRRVGQPESLAPSKLVKEIQSIAQLSRHAWPPSLLREMWQRLMDEQEGRRESPQHESRWLNMIGYCLRPGYGVAVDDWRVAQTWRAIHGKLAFPDVASRCESMILYRRVAGGLTTGQQTQLAAPLISAVKNKSRRLEPNEAAEVWRLLGSLERLPLTEKTDLAAFALNFMKQSKNEKLRPVLLWTLGRIASRQITYGPLNCTVPADPVARWIGELEELFVAGKFSDCRHACLLTLVQMSRRTGDRFRDLPQEQVARTVHLLERNNAPDHYVTLLTDGGVLQTEEETAIFGEALPLGIRLVR